MGQQAPRMGKAQAAGLAIGGLLVVLVIGIVWYAGRGRTEPDRNGDTAPGETAYTTVDLNLAVAAVAAAEDLQFEQALELWQELAAKYPDLIACQINEAVTVLKWIDVSNNALSSGTIQDPQQRQELEAALEEAYSRADQLIERLSAVKAANSGQIALLQAALLEAQARRLPIPEDEQVRRRAAEVIRDALAEQPAQPVLAAKFDEIILPLAGQADDVLARQNADFLYAAWQAEPRNLYLLSRAADTLLQQQDKRLLDLLEPSVELSKPMRAEVARDMRSLKLDELIPQVRQAVEAGEWRKAFQLKRWLNVLKGMSGFRSDLRLVKPDVLALLDTEFLGEFARQVRSNQPRPTASGDDGFSLTTAAVDATAGAVAWFDVDLDLDFDLVVLNENQLQIYTLVDGAFGTEASQTLALDGTYRGCLVAEFFAVDDTNRNRKAASVAELMTQPDAAAESPNAQEGSETEPLTAEQIRESNRHDTYQELVLWGPSGIKIVTLVPGAESGGASSDAPLMQLTVLEEPTGLEGLTDILAAAVLDIESDGDLDLLVSSSQGLSVFQNNGNRTFEDITAFSDLSLVPAGIESIRIGDVDGDLDQDALLVSPQAGHICLLENILHSQFRGRTLDDRWPEVEQPNDLVISDFDGNGSWDFAATTGTGLSVVRTRTPQPGQLVPMADVLLDGPGQCLAQGDMNNDGFEDLLVGGAQGLAIHFGMANGEFSSAVSQANAVASVSQILVVDANRDGVLDAAIVDGGQARVLWGQGEANYLAVRVRGINDSNGGGRINHYSVGTVLEVWANDRRQRQIVTQPVTHFGLGDAAAENLRIIFNNGLTQNVERPAVNTLVEEKQELKGSCPFIYGWDGQQFVLITDALWNAPLGLQTARGEVLPDRRWENLLLPGEAVQPQAGVYELRFTEELWEVAYVDHVQLTAIDHPADVRVFTNEKVGPPAMAEHRVFGFRDEIYPESAIDSAGRDVLAKLRHLDRDYAQAFDQLIHQGLAEPHFVELEFGELPEASELFLCLSGWMHPTDTSLNIGISQNPDRQPPEPPSLWTLDADGRWQCVRPFIGFPGGKPKSIVVSLKDVFLTDDHRLRIGASQQIYWDEIFVAADHPESVTSQPLVLKQAQLHYRGFSQLMPRAADQPHWYDYQRVSMLPKWPRLEGPFTRFGDVQDLLVADDDRMVVMTSGDEIQLHFSAPKDALPNGWKRDFVLHSAGWDKDADINTLAGQSSLPLPFAAQSQYPPGLQDAEQVGEVWQKNVDTLTRRWQVWPAEMQ